MFWAGSGYNKMPKHASIACRQLADFVGRKTETIFSKNVITKEKKLKRFGKQKVPLLRKDLKRFCLICPMIAQLDI